MALHRRIIIIGCGGSGKSTFARTLGESTGIPVVHLDRLYWQPGWQKTDRDSFDSLLATELAKPEWVMDGNFDRTLPMRLTFCDAVVYLDLPRLVCLFGVIRRVTSFHGRTRPDMGEGCPERFDFDFIKWVWDFNKKNRNKYLTLLGESGKTV